jgi:hypothetical protein
MVVGCLGSWCWCFICKLPDVVLAVHVHLFAGAVCVLLLELNTDGVNEVWMDFSVSGFVLFLLRRAQLCLFFFLE